MTFRGAALETWIRFLRNLRSFQHARVGLPHLVRLLVSRLSASRRSPRSSRSTTSCLRCADQRRTGVLVLMDTSHQLLATTEPVSRIFEGKPRGA